MARLQGSTGKLFRISILACSLYILPFAPAADAASIFGFKAYAKTSLKPFPKWRRVLDTYTTEPRPCNGKVCGYKQWKELVEGLRGKSRKYQLGRVNSYLNKYRYIIDPVNWGVRDYWEIPKEFFAKFGDCEDYAIVKYISLRALGWKAEDMKIIVLQDLNLKIAHAILAVNFEKKEMILDNQIGLVIDSKRIKHYLPIYAVNEKGWWRYKRT